MIKTSDTFGGNGQTRGNTENRRICKKQTILFALLICATIALGFVSVAYHETTTFTPTSRSRNGSWDYLLFTQQWPISYCIAFAEEKKKPATECNFGKNKYAWTIHGIWPSISNSIRYSQFCRRIPFNATTIAPIKDELLEHWSTIQKDAVQTYLWKHEWLKHGTCAVQIDPLNTELKYFNQGLKWNKQYNIADAFAKCGIYPDDAILYTNNRVIDCVKREFNAEPQIFCASDNVRNQLMLTEVRFCLNKNLVLENCYTFGAPLRCNDDFIYPRTVADINL